MIGTPKACVAKDCRTRVKTSLWPFCIWILASSKVILTIFDFQKCQRAQGGSTQKSIKYMANPPCHRYASITKQQQQQQQFLFTPFCTKKKKANSIKRIYSD